MGRVYEYIQHNFKGALQSKILKQVIDSFDKVYVENMPKLGHINLEKIYAVNDVPILKPPSKKSDKEGELGNIYPDLTIDDLKCLCEKKLKPELIRHFSKTMISIYYKFNQKP